MSSCKLLITNIRPVNESIWSVYAEPVVSIYMYNRAVSPLDGPGKKKIRCTPRGTKVVIYHLVGNFMLNSMRNVVSLATCAESL